VAGADAVAGAVAAGSGLAPLEVASGLVLGVDPPPALAPPPAGDTPLAALERAILPALLRPPCLVSFSGGRDSSAVLGVAARLADREGLAPPVPATNRFPGAEGSDESEWQELVVRHLGLEDWLRLEHADELDVVGPVAQKVLRRHGLLWPFNAHFHVPLLREARGGSLLTGAGGDEIFSPSRWGRVARVLARRTRPRPRDAAALALAFAPAALKRAELRRRVPHLWTWLRPEAHRLVRDALAWEQASEPVGWAASFRWWRGHRYFATGIASLGLLARDEDVQLGHPLANEGFVSVLAALPGPARYFTRTEGMRRIFAGVLPDELLARPTKASFDRAFWGPHSRAAAAELAGEGVDRDLVDVEALREVWAGEQPDSRSYTLLQSAWLARHRLEQPLAGGAERAPAVGPP
jgi:asparagine synthase (glutamine-hydrolysing)